MAGVAPRTAELVEYALRAVVHLAMHAPHPQKTADIAAATQVPTAYLAKVLQGLREKEIVVLQRGIGGVAAAAACGGGADDDGAHAGPRRSELRRVACVLHDAFVLTAGEPHARDPASSSAEDFAVAAEACDDGNFVNGDGCDNNCTLSACGNFEVGGNEFCDDGNLTNGDGCDSNCTPSSCGNGVKAPNESCDDGNFTNGDGCDDNCTATACGNGITTGAEECDDGNASNGDNCVIGCRNAACGDGFVDCERGIAARDRNAELGEDGLGLMLVNVHEFWPLNG